MSEPVRESRPLAQPGPPFVAPLVGQPAPTWKNYVLEPGRVTVTWQLYLRRAAGSARTLRNVQVWTDTAAGVMVPVTVEPYLGDIEFVAVEYVQEITDLPAGYDAVYQSSSGAEFDDLLPSGSTGVPFIIHFDLVDESGAATRYSKGDGVVAGDSSPWNGGPAAPRMRWVQRDDGAGRWAGGNAATGQGRSGRWRGGNTYL